MAFAGAPFFGGDFPDFGGEAAGNVVAVFGGDETQALLFGDAARGDVWDGFGSAQDGEAQSVEPTAAGGPLGVEDFKVPGAESFRSWGVETFGTATLKISRTDHWQDRRT